MSKGYLTLLGFLLFIIGFLGIVLSFVGLQFGPFQYLGFLSQSQIFLVQLLCLFGGVVVMYVSKTQEIEE